MVSKVQARDTVTERHTPVRLMSWPNVHNCIISKHCAAHIVIREIRDVKRIRAEYTE